MEGQTTLLVTIRNRDARRFEQLAGSIRRNGGRPRIILVDYGSEEAFSGRYAEVASANGIEYVKMWTQGWPWNKCRAINHGVRLADTEFVCTSDVDMLYVTDPFSCCLDRNEPRTMFHIDTYWLDPDGRMDRARPAGRGNPGGFQFVARKAFEESGGYDERMVYWGMEDLDWPERLQALGYRQEWLPEPHKIYHQWHPRSEVGHRRPETASFNTMAACVGNRLQPVLRQDWGRGVNQEDRPILVRMKSGRLDYNVSLASNALMHYDNISRIAETRRPGAFVRLDLGSRAIRRPFSALSRATKALLRPAAALTGLSCIDKLNCNFDYLHAMLPALLGNGLADYYIVSDVSEAYLLWR